MILTDGQANQGPTSASQILACVRTGKVSYGGGHISYGYGYGAQIPMQPPQQIQIQGIPNIKK